MLYTYQCPTCGRKVDEARSVSDRDRAPRCSGCAVDMPRIFTPTKIRVNLQNHFKPHFNHAFGKVMNSKQDIKDEIRKMNYEQGRDIVEVGNDDYPEDHAPQPKPYTLDD